VTNNATLLLEQLARYAGAWPAESTTTNDFKAFLKSHDDSFQCSCGIGHITGSAFIVDPTITRTLLVHHRKLGKWLQPGGHCDPGETALEAAVREAWEETGVSASALSPESLFDIDIHQIPARADTPDHLHYDARYILIAEIGTTVTSHESHAVEWVSMEEAVRRNPEQSISRMIAKAKSLLKAKA
jgi:8-oxo-dGTP pyrophosphatase MutT (NUDIX family)